MNTRLKRLTGNAWMMPLFGLIMLLIAAILAPMEGVAAPAVTDQSITDAIEDEFLFDRGVPLNKVDVMTDEGILTLTGEVDSWMEYHSATENAYEGGAVWVYNKLDVK